jgi:AraC-like DNA-binding protein
MDRMASQSAPAPFVYRIFVPPPPFDAFVENLWYWEGFDPGHAKDTIMASGRVCIQINLKRDELAWYDGDDYGQRHALSGIGLCGAQTSCFAIDAFQASNMGVQFKPGGAVAFFDCPARDFENAHIPLSDLWGPEAERLHQRIVQAPAPDDKIEILFRALTQRFLERTRDPAVELALARMVGAPQRVSIARLAREAEVSQKKLIRLFADQIGTTPKTYLRIARFQRVLARVHEAPSVDWMEIVERHGYYDQPHFIREFREFSGFTPSDYFKRRGPYLQHVPLAA